jgi:hypothetical protein
MIPYIYGTMVRVGEKSNLRLRAILIASQTASSKYNIAPTSFKEISPESNIEGSPHTGVFPRSFTLLKFDESIFVERI